MKTVIAIHFGFRSLFKVECYVVIIHFICFWCRPITITELNALNDNSTLCLILNMNSKVIEWNLKIERIPLPDFKLLSMIIYHLKFKIWNWIDIQYRYSARPPETVRPLFAKATILTLQCKQKLVANRTQKPFG